MTQLEQMVRETVANKPIECLNGLLTAHNEQMKYAADSSKQIIQNNIDILERLIAERG